MKEWIIKKLGGYTKKDIRIIKAKARLHKLKEIKTEMDKFYGTDWSDYIYRCTESNIKQLEDIINASN